MNLKMNILSAALTLILVLLFFSTTAVEVVDEEEQQPLPSSSTWFNIKAALTHPLSFFFPPNIDFRGTHHDSAPAGGGGGGDKVKEAAGKSLVSGKDALQDSAKSAAHLAKQNIQQFKQKLKDAFFSHNNQPDL